MSTETTENKGKLPENLSRRAFLTGTGAVLVGGALLAGRTATADTGTNKTEAEAPAVPEWPWPYVELDPEVVRKKGHLGYYNNACSYGAFWSVIDTLKEEVGFPYDQLPAELMFFGEGGVAGWSTTCGALLGASAAISLVTDKDGTKALVNELMGWYTQESFPSDISNQYAEDKVFLVEKYKYEQALPQSVAGSPLCHQSVTEWCLATGLASGSAERSERCGRLTGDVAAKAVELLNAYHAGTFEPAFKASAETKLCTTCHTTGEDFAAGHFTRGKMECTACHEPHELTQPLPEPEEKEKK